MLQEKKIRKQISLDSQTIESLQHQAEKSGKNLKEYMEHILLQQANEFEITDEYKAMMDEILEQHAKGEIKYISREEFFSRVVRK